MLNRKCLPSNIIAMVVFWALVQIGRPVEWGNDVVAVAQADSTAFQIAGVVVPSMRNFPRLNCPLYMRRINSIPASVIEAALKRLKPSIGPVRAFSPRWSCSIKLFKYFDERRFVSAGNKPSSFISRTARWEAAYSSNVIVRGEDPWRLIALLKNALAAATSRRRLRWKSTVWPDLSTARQRYTHSSRTLI
jgi:hypothetical protein